MHFLEKLENAKREVIELKIRLSHQECREKHLVFKDELKSRILVMRDKMKEQSNSVIKSYNVLSEENRNLEKDIEHVTEEVRFFLFFI